jgi:hypothetical protein
MLDDGGIRSVFEEHPDDLHAAAKGLVNAANRVGGDDNITVVCFAMDDDMPQGDTVVGIDAPTEEDTLHGISGLDAPTAVEPVEEERRGLFVPALLGAAVVAIGVLVWLVLR